MTKLQDKKAITQLLAGLMAYPERSVSKEYDLTTDDFVEKIHKIILAAITNLYQNDAVKTTPLEIDGYLSQYADQYRIFNDNEGLDYLFTIQALGEPENFNMHYQRVKKFSFLRECKKIGINVSDIYDENVVDLVQEQKRNELFDSMSLEDMIKHIELKIIDIKDQFLIQSMSKGGHMAENVQTIIDSKLIAPSYGAPQASQYLNAIFRGSRLKKLHLKHGNTGGGKSRLGMANMAVKTIPEIWDSASRTWIKTGANKSGLVISTELDEEEVKLPFIAYIADVDESLIHEAKTTKEEKERILIAIQILEKSKLWFEVMSDFDIEEIETVIVKYITKYNVQYIEFDYIHTSLKLLSSLASKGVKNLREDQILLIIAITLKNLCNTHNVHVESATQLNDNQNKDDNMDQSWIRGSKALADKIDGGYILLEIRPKDQKIIEAIYQSGKVKTFGLQPNMTLNVYKSRGSRWKRIRVFGHFNAGTLRFTDLFCLNYKHEIVDDLQMKEILFDEIGEESEVETEDGLPDSFND